MSKTITLRDMRQAVDVALGTYADDFDIDGIVTELHRAHGLVDIDGLDTDEFWAVVEQHAKPGAS